MLNNLLKDLSILKKFLFINLIIFLLIGSLTIIYLNYVQPNLIKKKTSIHIQILNNIQVKTCVQLFAHMFLL